MEQTGVMSEEAWRSLSGMYSSKEESEFLSEFLSGFSCPNELTYGLNMNGTRSGLWSSDQETSSMVCSSDLCNSNECLVSQETSTFSPDDGQSVLYLNGTFLDSDDVYESSKRPGRVSWIGDSADDVMELRSGRFLCPISESIMDLYGYGGLSDQYDLSDIGKIEKQELDVREGDLPNGPRSKKRSRNVADVSRSKRNLKSDKYQKVVSDNDKKNDDSNPVITRKSSVSHSTEEHSNITQEITKGEIHNTKTSKTSGGKGKSGKGASSDPQSLYARKRRERINERLRILQSLVPNGTKVDISTMLEEAVQYVKFLQLQIKLLSSDDTWMYAPLAYNGMDIGISNFDTTSTA